MSDFWNTFTSRREEDEEQRRLGNFDPFAVSERAAERAAATRPPEFQRNFMDRVFAPFEAPQQTLFALTQAIGEDGFQARDLWTAISHGMNYFNPFGNTERIRPDEIRKTFGIDVDPDERRTWRNSAVDLAFSIFYDPLWLLPPLAAAAKAGRIGKGTYETARRIVNPGTMIFDAGRIATNKGVRPAMRAMAKAAGREQEYVDFSTRLTQMTIDRFAGVPAQMREYLGQIEGAMRDWVGLGAKAVNQTAKLGPKARVLLAEAVEMEAVLQRRMMGGPLTKRATEEYADFTRKLAREGIDEDLFWQAYQQVQGFEMGLGEQLVRNDLVPYAEFAEWHGRHLRRHYTAFDNPLHAVERVEELLNSPAIPTRFRGKNFKIFDQTKLRGELQKAAGEFDTRLLGPDVPGPGGTRQTGLFAPGTGMGFDPSVGSAGRYFPPTRDGGRRFDADRFMNDFGDYLKANPQASLHEAMRHVKDEMFKGSAVPAEFSRVLQNYIINGQVTTPGLLGWKERFMQMGHAPAVEMRTYRSNMEALARRQNIPEIIRREVLGEVQDAAPRLAQDVLHGARQLVINEAFDGLSGAVRVDANLTRLVNRVHGAAGGKRARDPQAYNELFEAVGRKLNTTDPEKIVPTVERLLAEGGEGALRETQVMARSGSSWASEAPTEVNTYRLPQSESMGSLSGMYVRPGVASHLLQYERVARAAAGGDMKARNIQEFISDMMARTTGQFKFMKIVADPGANFRDTVGTLMQLDVTTGLPFNVHRLISSFNIARDYAGGTANKYTDLAHSVGYRLMDHGWSATELGKIASRRDLARLRFTADNWNDTGTNLFRGLGEAVGATQDNIAGWYQLRENMFRTYVFSSTYDNLASQYVRAGRELTPEVQRNFARQAAAKTDQALFNYADIPYAAEWARQYGVAPFITFPIKSTQQLVSNLMERPHRVLRYERGLDTWNEHHAGGTDQFLREIAALPEHKRDALVARIPGTDKDGNAMYLDLSYFIPWYAIKDIAQDITSVPSRLFGEPDPEDESSRRRMSGDMGMRSSVVAPILFQIYDAIKHGRDGLGRELWKETDDVETRIMGIGKWLYQFMTPPTAPGGVTADSVGRAMLAVARTSPEPMDWAEVLGSRMRDPFQAFPDPHNELDRYGRRPTSRALTGAESTIFGDLGPDGNLAANAAASLFLNVTASDPTRQTMAERTRTSVTNTEIYRQMAQVRSNRNMSSAEKQAELRRLQGILIENQRAYVDRVRAMR